MTPEALIMKLHNVKKTATGWQACCPSHDDRDPSLAVSLKGSKILLHCFAGCSTEAICQSIGIEVKDLFTDKPQFVGPAIEHFYHNENGQHIFSVYRRKRSDGSKAVWSYPAPGFNEDDKRDAMRKYIYQLPGVLDAIKFDGRIYIAEGEKCVDALWKIGLPATCNPGGALKWRDEHSQWFSYPVAPEVIIFPDVDEPGRKHAELVAQSIYKYTKNIRIVELPDLARGEDVYDWIERNGN